MNFYFRLSSTSIHYEIATFNFTAWAGVVGGFASAFFSVVGLIWSEIGRVIYYRTIMRSLFFYKQSIFAKKE